MDLNLPIILRLCMAMLSAALVVCVMISTATSNWAIFSHEINGRKMNVMAIGLWKEYNLDNQNNWHKQSIFEDPMITVGKWMYFVRTFMILANVTSVVTLFFIFLTFFWKPKLYFVSAISSMLTCCFTMVAVIIFHRDNKWTKWKVPQPFDYGWSFSLAIMGIVISAVIFLMGLFVCIYADDKEVQKVNYQRQHDL